MKSDGAYDFGNNSGEIQKKMRRVPIFLIIKIWLRNAMIIMGIILSLFMLPFSMKMVPFADFFAPSFSNEDPVKLGVITESNETGAQIGSERVYEYYYQYQLPDGRIYSKKGYNSGERKQEGDEISVFYKQGDPSKFRAADLRNSLFGGYGAAVFILIFQTGGLILLYYGTRKVIRRIYILRAGMIANGRLIRKEPDDAEIRENTIYTLTYEFTASDFNSYQVVVTPSLFDLPRLIDNSYEMLIYDPEKPENAVLLDQLPKVIRNYFLGYIG